METFKFLSEEKPKRVITIQVIESMVRDNMNFLYDGHATEEQIEAVINIVAAQNNVTR